MADPVCAQKGNYPSSWLPVTISGVPVVNPKNNRFVMARIKAANSRH